MKKIGIVVLSFLISFSLISATFAADLFEKDIKYGVTKNDDIKQLQDFLYNEGFYKGQITGNFFSLTRNALKKYQLANKITPANGLLNSATREKLNSTLLAQENASEEVLGGDDVSYTADDEAARLAWVARMTSLQNQNVSQETQPTVQPIINNYYTSPVTYNVLPVVTSSPQVISSPEPIPNQVVTTTKNNQIKNLASSLINISSFFVYNASSSAYSIVDYPYLLPPYVYGIKNILPYYMYGNGKGFSGMYINNSINPTNISNIGFLDCTDRNVQNYNGSKEIAPQIYKYGILTAASYIRTFSIQDNHPIKNITLKNLGTADLSKLDFKAQLQDGTLLNITNFTKDTISFDNNNNPINSPIDFIVNTHQVVGTSPDPLIGKTLNLQVTNADLIENDTYLLQLPLPEINENSIIICQSN